MIYLINVKYNTNGLFFSRECLLLAKYLPYICNVIKW